MSRHFARRLLLAFTGATLVFAAAASAHAQEVLNGIAAIVNNEVITFSQVRELIGEKEMHLRQTLKGQELVEKIKEVRLAAINDLIDRQLIILEFKTKGYQIPDYYIEESVAKIIREEFGGDRQAFLKTLAAQNFTLDRFRELEKDKIIVGEMRRQAIKSAASISDAQIADYYKKNIANYTSEEQVKLRMITIRGSEENKARRKMLEEIREKAQGGVEFGGLAKMYSEDGNQEAYGDWGWIDRKKLDETLTKVAFSLKPGEISKVVELGGSYYLLSVEAKKASTVKPLKEVRDEIEKALTQSERQRLQQEWLLKLRKKAYIKVY